MKISSVIRIVGIINIPHNIHACKSTLRLRLQVHFASAFENEATGLIVCNLSWMSKREPQSSTVQEVSIYSTDPLLYTQNNKKKTFVSYSFAVFVFLHSILSLSLSFSPSNNEKIQCFRGSRLSQNWIWAFTSLLIVFHFSFGNKAY